MKSKNTGLTENLVKMNLYELVLIFSQGTHVLRIQIPNVNIIFSLPFLIFSISNYNDELGTLNHINSLCLSFNINRIGYDNLPAFYFQVV